MTWLAELSLPGQAEADQFVELLFKPASLAERGLPSGPYPIRREALDRLIASGGDLPTEAIVRGLMDWLDVTDDPRQATDMIHEILRVHCPDDGKRGASCTFQNEYGQLHRLLLGDVDTQGPLVAWQRRNWLMMVAAPSAVEPGRFLVAAPRAISSQTAQAVVDLSCPIYMGEPTDSFAMALASSRGTSSFYSWERGQTTLIEWEHGLGATMIDGTIQHRPNLLPGDDWLAPNQLAILVAIGADYA